eukprot:3375042-Alexandrium_andersonii.AAC.1
MRDPLTIRAALQKVMGRKNTHRATGPSSQKSMCCTQPSLGGRGPSSPQWAKQPSPRLGICKHRSPPVQSGWGLSPQLQRCPG